MGAAEHCAEHTDNFVIWCCCHWTAKAVSKVIFSAFIFTAQIFHFDASRFLFVSYAIQASIQNTPKTHYNIPKVFHLTITKNNNFIYGFLSLAVRWLAFIIKAISMPAVCLLMMRWLFCEHFSASIQKIIIWWVMSTKYGW